MLMLFFLGGGGSENLKLRSAPNTGNIDKSMM